MDAVVGSVYQHYKGEKYLVLFVLQDETNERVGNKIVVYRAVDDGKVFARDYSQFTEVVEWPDGKKRPRFSSLETKPAV